MPRVTLTGYIQVPLEELSAICAELPNHIALTRNEPGCLHFEVIQDSEDPSIFHVDEAFSDHKAFEQHQVRVKSSDWGAITSNVQRHYEIKEAPQ